MGDLEVISRGDLDGDLEGCSRGGDVSLVVNSAGAVAAWIMMPADRRCLTSPPLTPEPHLAPEPHLPP